MKITLVTLASVAGLANASFSLNWPSQSQGQTAPFFGSQPGSSQFSQPGAMNSWMSSMPSQSAGSPPGGQPGWNQPAFATAMGAPFGGGQFPAQQQQQPWNTFGTMTPWQQGSANPWGGFQSSPSLMAGPPWGSPQPYGQQSYSPYTQPWGPSPASANGPWRGPPQAPSSGGCPHRRRGGHLRRFAHRARRAIEGAAQDLGDTARGAAHGLQRTLDNFTDPDYRSGSSGSHDYYDRY